MSCFGEVNGDSRWVRGNFTRDNKGRPYQGQTHLSKKQEEDRPRGEHRGRERTILSITGNGLSCLLLATRKKKPRDSRRGLAPRKGRKVLRHRLRSFFSRKIERIKGSQISLYNKKSWRGASTQGGQKKREGRHCYLLLSRRRRRLIPP